MRLKHVKLAGFKSFVDPTTVSVPADLVGVVGPNGCGKSNVIDAVRWVMGESSAKTLRGDSMDDVIFNGSAARKPIGKATVELVFDNSEGKAPGPYAKYAEIAIRRELTRAGQSHYFINRTKCRRRDITDIFLGTGLGPRSYSIIEQGMVSRIIEAKPEDLLVLIEEAAGISKYKERRRETENRIRHTRENLDRVNDIRSELETQLRRLKRQSSAAARYKNLKREERTVRSQLLSLRWRSLDDQVKRKDADLAQQDKNVDLKLAEQRAVENEIERLRKTLSEDNEALNKINGEFYGIGSEIASVEQSIEHLHESREQRQSELERLIQNEKEGDRHLASDLERIKELERSLSDAAPALEQRIAQAEQAQTKLQSAEQAYQDWQNIWETFTQDATRPEKDGDIQRTRIEEQERQIAHLKNKQQRLQESLADITTQADDTKLEDLRLEVTQQDEVCEDLERQLEDLEEKVLSKRGEIDEITEELQTLREQHQTASARLASLQELQDIALGDEDEPFNEWLAANGMWQVQRLSNELEVEAGWERALDRVLGARVSAICVDKLDLFAGAPTQLKADIFVIEKGTAATGADQSTLAHKVRSSNVDLSDWLANIKVVDDLPEALAQRADLSDDESIVTRSGAWVGRKWLAMPQGDGARAGMLERERELTGLKDEVASLAEGVGNVKLKVDAAQALLFDMEEQRAEQRRELSRHMQKRTELHNRYGRNEERNNELLAREKRLQTEIEELAQQLFHIQSEISQAQTRLQSAEQQTQSIHSQRAELTEQRASLQHVLASAKEEAEQAREARHRAEFEQQRSRTTLEGLQEGVARLEQQKTSSVKRRQELEALLGSGGEPEERLKAQLGTLLQKRVAVEKRLATARKTVSEHDEKLRKLDQDRHQLDQAVQELREQRDAIKLQRQELLVRRDTVHDQLREVAGEPDDPLEVLRSLPENMTSEQVDRQLADLTRRIDRIGPVNLVAIEEYEEQSERKEYLDKQHGDLVEALETLESVMHKIDRETRARFKDTFETLGARFQEFFPRLFGGGSAYLELTSQDLLETGVSVMARPPGKRNSTIHLLSGGEKALSAVALLFAFFDLNPAPFCMLDEVDAPLDDANVERYSEVLKTLASRTQLIFITHNKITMEAANILIGVTMGEPGVSRLVAVDVDEAVQMAAQ